MVLELLNPIILLKNSSNPISLIDLGTETGEVAGGGNHRSLLSPPASS